MGKSATLFYEKCARLIDFFALCVYNKHRNAKGKFMSLREMIYKRKSVRKYTAQKVDSSTLFQIQQFIDKAKPLYPRLKTRIELVERSKIKSPFPWTPPHAIVAYGELKDGAYENAGFILQQIELYLETLGLGVCWLGMGKPDVCVAEAKDGGLKYLIMLGFGYPDEPLFREASQFKRKTLEEIADRTDERLEAARLAPSSVNSQPWYFTHDGDCLRAYCRTKGLLNRILGNMNRIDMGIALAHLYVEHGEGFHFAFEENVRELSGYRYSGSVRIE